MTVTVNKERWKQAQENELRLWKHHPDHISDDWNMWWKKQFDNYSAIKELKISSVLEVGCGPFAQNIQYVLSSLSSLSVNIALNDSLLFQYIEAKKPVANFIDKFRVSLYACSLEELKTKEHYDCVVCINVLGHAFCVDDCMKSIEGVLSDDGILILGEDLTNDVDLRNYPQADVMHPLRFDRSNMDPFLNKYRSLFDKVLSREEGRNPQAHCGTLLFIGRKNDSQL